MSAVWRMSDFKNIFITILCQNYLRGRSPWLPAAPRGIGNAIVRKFVEEGAKVVLCGSRQATAEKALEALKKDYPDAIVSAIWPALSGRASCHRRRGDLTPTFQTASWNPSEFSGRHFCF